MKTFVVNFYRDYTLAIRLAQQIRKFYPGSPLVFIGDGVTDAGGHLRDHGAVVEASRLKNIITGQWTARYLEIALALGDSDVIIKLDPDACLHRKFEIPFADWFGTIGNSGTFVRGGACGFSRWAAQKLAKSMLMQIPMPFTYERYRQFRWGHEEESDELLSCQDLIVGHVAAELGIVPAPWKDVHILGNELKVPDVESFALTHPHPHLRSDQLPSTFTQCDCP